MHAQELNIQEQAKPFKRGSYWLSSSPTNFHPLSFFPVPQSTQTYLLVRVWLYLHQNWVSVVSWYNTTLFILGHSLSVENYWVQVVLRSLVTFPPHSHLSRPLDKAMEFSLGNCTFYGSSSHHSTRHSTGDCDRIILTFFLSIV